MATTETVTIKILAQDMAIGPINALNVAMGNLAAIGIQAVITGLGDLVRGLKDVATESVNLAADFEEQITILTIAAGEDLHDVALQIGADSTLMGISATEAADGLTTLYKAGLTTTDVFGDLDGYMAGTTELSGAMRAAINLQAASSLDLAQATDAVAVAMATFGLDADQAVSIADNFVQSADASIAEVEDLTEAMKNFGPTAASYGMSLEETNTLLAVLSTRGIKGAEAGTNLKSMFINMMRPVDKVKEALEQLNVSLFDQNGYMKDSRTIIDELNTAMKDANLTEKERIDIIQILGGNFGQKALNTLLQEGVEGYDAMSAAINAAADSQTIATTRTETYRGRLEALESVIETTKIGLGEMLLKGLQPLVEGITEFIEEHGPELQEVFAELGEWLGELAEQLLPLLVEVVEEKFIPALENFPEWWEKEGERTFKEFSDSLTAKDGLVADLATIADAIVDVIEAFGKLGDMVDTITGKGTWMRETTDKWKESIKGLADAFLELLNPLDELIYFFPELDRVIPDWLKPGSPTPLELGLGGIRDEVSKLARLELPQLSAAMAIGGAGGLAGMAANNTTTNSITLNVHTQATNYSAVGDYLTLKALSGA